MTQDNPLSELERGADERQTDGGDRHTLAALELEIRTPMSSIVGMADLLLDTPLDSKQRAYANIVRDSTEQILAILNDLIDSSKLTQGALKLSSADFDVTSAVESAAAACSVSAEATGVSLMTDISPDVPSRLRGDSERLRDALTGIIAGAVESSANGELIVGVERDPTYALPSRVAIRFSVTRIGQARVDVKPDTSVRAALTSRVRRGIIELLGGELVERDEADGRHVISFTAQFEQPQSSYREADSEGGLDSDLSRLRVLLVDDSKSTRDILSRYFASWNMRCDAVGGAADAVISLRTAASAGWNYDVAIIDLAMPGINGFDLASIIKSDRAFASMALILLTAHDELEPSAAERMGFSASLTKPVRQSSLFDAIANVFYAGRLPASSARATRMPPVSKTVLVLLVEDNLANQRLAIAQLESMGCAVRALSNGHDAVQEVARNGDQYALVLMDCQMPEMDGFAATQAIREAEAISGQHVPIIAMTANAMQGAREECLRRGMDDYLAKPVSRDRLREMVRKWAR